ncbi:hypothetical protein NFI95_02355 [Acetobacteraceae bacterium KSS8]|uniref:Lipoprotein n=1 Tax=Endosaccharibacter trunci TaxID=2812733 RepID=A0ABT1W572_9PROT|nr:hypothetical protein [Acetobacteraceae bacterium KSS8]
MRPSARFATILPRPVAALALPTMLMLGGCSGLGHFLGDTEEPPGYNPNGVLGSSENLLRARGRSPVAQPMLPQAGNVWPGPPQPLPTLSDVSHGYAGTNPLAGGTLPRGGSMSMGEQNAIRGGAPLDSGFSGGEVQAPIADPARAFEKREKSSAGASSDIVIPNGDGTSTVISPDGSVKTVKGTPK